MKRKVKPNLRKYYVFQGFNESNTSYLGIIHALSPGNAAIEAHMHHWHGESGNKVQDVIERDGFYQVCFWEPGKRPSNIFDPSNIPSSSNTDSNYVPTFPNEWYYTYEYIILDKKPPISFKINRIKSLISQMIDQTYQTIALIIRDIKLATATNKTRIALSIKRIKSVVTMNYDTYNRRQENEKRLGENYIGDPRS